MTRKTRKSDTNGTHSQDCKASIMNGISRFERTENMTGKRYEGAMKKFITNRRCFCSCRHESRLCLY
jgi:hypothetical protein